MYGNEYIDWFFGTLDQWSLQFGSGDTTLDLLLAVCVIGVVFSLVGQLDLGDGHHQDGVGVDDLSGAQASAGTESPVATGIPKVQLQSQLGRSRNAFWSRIREALGGGSRVSGETFEVLEAALLASDIGPGITQHLMDSVLHHAKGEGVEFSIENLRRILEDEITKVLNKHGRNIEALAPATSGVTVIMIIGVNGAGKTTTIAKLANLYQKSGKRVLLVAADTFRAAAIEQLELWGKRSGVPVFRGPDSAKPASVVFDGVKAGVDDQYDIVLIDTAGRLHTKNNLMQELEGITNSVRKIIPEGPHERWLVLDGTSGQNGLIQARQFHESVPLTGVIVTKLDGTSKGGVVVSVVNELGVPVRFIGVGEGPEDLQVFDARDFAHALFGMDDGGVQNKDVGQTEHGSVRSRKRGGAASPD
jgi:fused signal recognition particle receptor